MRPSLTSFFRAIGPKSPVRPQVELAQIDESLRVPCLLFFTAALLWLLIGTVFAIIASTTLHSPNMYPGWEWLTFGRMRSAHLNAMAYGWGNNAAFAIMIWIMARLSRTEVKHGGLLIIAGVFWNIGLLIGVYYMLVNGITSVEWLEMPTFVAPLLAISYTMIGVWAVMSFYFRRSEHVYVSQWYILAAAFWFPWLYIVAQVMILWVPARGTVQAITNWWFGHNALGLWFTPIALSA
ncbi:MAG TPA: cbb3-type cytochrome c oxidase subunit I, partial [Opitutales bacterium]|nr:cbb3-type cytochrome c oxidase subunit I [Opitutales bacterium]